MRVLRSNKESVMAVLEAVSVVFVQVHYVLLWYADCCWRAHLNY
jgi:hypothetical protein